MKRMTLLAILVSSCMLFAGTANATLRVIGTATYNGSVYKLIWDDENNGRSIVWLDFSNNRLSHEAQVAWASGLNNAGILTYSIDPAYSVSWNGAWRLPATVDRALQPQPPGSPVSGSLVQYSFTGSEMGHLYYTDLGNLPYVDASGNVVPDWGLRNKGPFDNLDRWFYWYETPAATGDYWIFNTGDGGENTSQEWGPSLDYTAQGLAVRDVIVTMRGGAVLFDNNTDTIAVDGHIVVTDKATYEARVLFTTTFARGGLVFNEWKAGVEDKFLGVDVTGLGAYSFPLSDQVLVAGASLASNTWHHVAYVYDGSEERLYLDGIRIAARAAIGNIANSDGLAFIGAIFRDGGISPGLVGYLDTLRISDVPRYSGSSFTPPSGDLPSDSSTLLLYNFNEAPESPTVTDVSGNGHTGTLGSGFTGATAPIVVTDPLRSSGVGTATIDGVMSPGEWDNAATFAFAANLRPSQGGGTTPATLLVMNDATTLYIAVKVAAPNLVYSSLGVEFDNDHDGIWPENGDDGIVLNSGLGFFDAVRMSCTPPSLPGYCSAQDKDVGGTTDGRSGVKNDGSYSFYELSHPLSSGDPNDVALAPGSTVGFFADLIFCPGDGGCAETMIPSTGFGAIVVASTANTDVGSNVPVEVDVTLPNGSDTTVSLTFDNVTTPGNTSLTTSSTGPPPASGFKLGTPPVYYEITTTATFSGTVRVCISWTEGQFANESHIRLFHRVGDPPAWVDITDDSSRDTVNNTLCGITTSLSPFALMEVKYPFAGFFQPVDNPPAVNAVKAGSAVPVKFGLGGDLGPDIFAPGYPRVELVRCETGSAMANIEVTVTAGGSSLNYDALTGQYNYVWKTEQAWAGSCRALQLKFNDGEQYSATFHFRR